MAGTFAHWMVAEQAMEDSSYQRGNKHPSLVRICEQNHFVYLGAVSPDYPYLTSILPTKALQKHCWADRMHYETIGTFISECIKLLSPNQSDFNACLAWLSGFVAHVVTDSVVHPVVNSIVGPYRFNSKEHRHCEMIQDSYIFNELKGVDLTYSGFVELLHQCSAPTDKEKLFKPVRELWAQALKNTYPEASAYFDDIDPDSWHKNYLSAVSPTSFVQVAFRHGGLIGEKQYMSYKAVSDITEDERLRFIEEVKLPDGSIGNYKQDVFYKAVNEVARVWSLLFDDIGSGSAEQIGHYIKNWNLDTGVDEDAQDFWPARETRVQPKNVA